MTNAHGPADIVPSRRMIPTVAVALGGALGSVARYWVGVLVVVRFGEGFPTATLLINVVGSFVIGAFAAATLPEGPHPTTDFWRLFVMVGVCGGFTTFSSFSLQTFALLRAGAPAAAAANVGLSVALCLVFVAVGWWVGARS